MSQTLSQVQIIQSLAEALSWFEKEIAWGVDPGELRSLTGRIGELYAAMITRGQMALATNQRGYDVVSADGERISVKTITSSSHVSFSRTTFDLVDRVIVLRINVDDETGISIEELFDLPAAEVRDRAAREAGDYRIATAARAREPVPLGSLGITDSAAFGPYTLHRYENGTIKVQRDDVEVPQAKPVLREIAGHVGVDIHYAEGKPKNTRQLGMHIIKTLNEQA